MRIGRIDINPARNPAVLDTGLWDEKAAVEIVSGVDAAHWQALCGALRAGQPLPRCPQLVAHGGSAAQCRGAWYVLASLADGQCALLEIGASCRDSVLGAPLAEFDTAAGRMAAYRTDAATLDRYGQCVYPAKAPKALGATPRLGIGVRMTTAVWPAVYEAMGRSRFAANSIQNSVRELELLDNILAGRAPEAIYYPGFGTVQAGHTGSTFEGLWVYGVLEALKSDRTFSYGADADHIKVASGAEGMARAKQVLDAARYYTFYTLDVSGVLDYHALRVDSASAAETLLSARIAAPRDRADVLAWHMEKRQIAGFAYAPDAATVGRLVGKYWASFDAAQAMTEHIRRLKNGRAFDLEFAIDERTAEIATGDCITTSDEVVFVLLELQRRGVPVTHLAPNFGVEKSVDYRIADGLAGLEARVRQQHRIAESFGVMLDFHSGDDLSATTRRVIGRATDGRNHFKISPMPQILFAETLRDLEPELFRRWWDETMAYARREAAGGSAFAAECVREFEAVATQPSPSDIIFHNFGFAFVGQRDAAGQYVNREALYSLPQRLYDEYRNRITSYLCGLADDLFGAARVQ